MTTYNLEYLLPSSQQKISVNVQKKKISTFRIRIKNTLEIYCSVPNRTTKIEVNAFIERNLAWIEENYFKVKSKQEEKYNTDIFKDEPIMFLGSKKCVKILYNNKNSVELTENELIIYTKKIDDKEYTQKIFDEYAKKILNDILTHFVKEYMDKIPLLQMPTIKIQRMKTMWGNCYYKKNLTHFNLNLIYTPISSIEYIVLHELTHFKHPNHSKAFYRDIEALMPNYKEREKRLTKY